MTRHLVAAVLVLGGAGALLFGEPARAWGAFTSNLLFWSSLAAGAVALSAAIDVCNGRWAAGTQALAARWTGPLAVCLLFLLVLPFGASAVWGWVETPVEGLEGWLSPGSLFGRDFVAAGLLLAVTLAYNGARGRSRTARAVVLLVVFVVVESLLAVDLVMSLEPRWPSTLFGAYFFIGGGYAALAALAWQTTRHEELVAADERHDLGKLLFAFALLWTYMFWSQYLVIWYGNLPRETVFWIARTEPVQWRLWGLAVLLACFAFPFVALIPRATKRNPRLLRAVAAVPLLGLWAERHYLVMPSVLAPDAAPIGWPEIAVGLGMAALMFGALDAPLTGRPGDVPDATR